MRTRHPSAQAPWRPDFVPPPPLSTPSWHLAPLHPDLSEVDHRAWSGCRERLRAELDWDGWPREGFSLEDNTADLARHYAEFENREAYAYSVLDARRCIGCIYVEPWHGGAQLAFWLIDDALHLEGEVVVEVLRWLAGWPFERVLSAVRPWNTRALDALADRGLERCEGPPGHVSFRLG